MFNLKSMAGCVGAAFALSYAAGASATISSPGALGEAFLHFTNFQIVVGNGALGQGDPSKGLPGTPISALPGLGTGGTETATTTAFLNGAAGTCVGTVPVCGSHDLGSGFFASTTIGAGFAPLGPLLPVTANTPALGNGSGGYSSSSGDSRDGKAEVYLHSLSQLSGNGATNASADQDVQATFTLSIAAVGVPIELSFNLDRFVRAGLGQALTKSLGQTTFSVTVTRSSTNEVIYNWTPNGSTVLDNGGLCNALSGDATYAGSCTTYSDPFGMQTSASANKEIVDRVNGVVGNNYTGTGIAQSGYFESELTFLFADDYVFTISSNATSNASIIPEPGSIALLGLGLLGLGAVSRRSRKV